MSCERWAAEATLHTAKPTSRELSVQFPRESETRTSRGIRYSVCTPLEFVESDTESKSKKIIATAKVDFQQNFDLI